MLNREWGGHSHNNLFNNHPSIHVGITMPYICTIPQSSPVMGRWASPLKGWTHGHQHLFSRCLAMVAMVAMGTTGFAWGCPISIPK